MDNVKYIKAQLESEQNTESDAAKWTYSFTLTANC